MGLKKTADYLVMGAIAFNFKRSVKIFTGIMCSVSVKYFQRPDTSRDPSDSLYPDVDVLITPEEYFSPIDTLWERVLNDIRNSNLYK